MSHVVAQYNIQSVHYRVFIVELPMGISRGSHIKLGQLSAKIITDGQFGY